jgi:hypothetical protein
MGGGGLFVMDALGLQENIALFESGVDGNYLGILGVLTLYSPSYYFGNAYCYIVNVCLLSFAAFFFLKTILTLGIKLGFERVYLIFAIVICNFYLLEVLFYPNKEIPLIFLTNAFIYYVIVRQNTLLVLMILLLSFLIRDGHGVILTLTYFAITFFRVTLTKHPLWILFFVFILFSILSLDLIAGLDILGDYNYVLTRNINLASNPDSVLSESILTGLPSYFAFPIKVFNHFVGSVLRPQIIDGNDRLYFSGVALWQNGMIIFLGMSSWLFILYHSKKWGDNVMIIGVTLTLGLLLISAGSYTQARYLMPYMFWLTAGFVMTLKLHQIVVASLALLILAAFLFFMGYGSLIPIGVDIDKIPYCEIDCF